MSSPSTSPSALAGPPRLDEPRLGLSFGLGIAVLLHLLVLLVIAAFPQIFLAPRLLWAQPDAKPPPLKITFMRIDNCPN